MNLAFTEHEWITKKPIHADDDDEEARKGGKEREKWNWWKKNTESKEEVKSRQACSLRLVYISFHYYVLTLMRYFMYNNIVYHVLLMFHFFGCFASIASCSALHYLKLSLSCRIQLALLNLKPTNDVHHFFPGEWWMEHTTMMTEKQNGDQRWLCWALLNGLILLDMTMMIHWWTDLATRWKKPHTMRNRASGPVCNPKVNKFKREQRFSIIHSEMENNF